MVLLPDPFSHGFFHSPLKVWPDPEMVMGRKNILGIHRAELVYSPIKPVYFSTRGAQCGL